MFDETLWPIVRMTMDASFTREAMESYIAKWEQCLGRGERFGLIVTQTSDQTVKPDRESTKAYMSWCKANKERIAGLCVGMGAVFASSRLLVLYKPMMAIATRRTYGCPGQVFATEEEALVWLLKQLEG